MRLIVCTTLEKAQKVQALAAANPADFGNLAKQWSEDAPSASIKGLAPPVRRYGPCPEIEEAAFGLADRQVSGVIRSAGQYVILKREGLIPASKITMAKAGPRLEKMIRDRKMRQVATDIFKELQKKARVQNVYNNTELRQQLGEGVVALVNGEPIYLSQLDEECVNRHGADVLQGLIGRRMLELDSAQHQVTVSEQEIDAEIALRPRRRPSLFPTARPTSNAGLRPPPGSKAFLRRPTDAKWSGRLWPCENWRWARSTSPTKTSKRDSLRTTAPAFAAGRLSWTISAVPRKSGRPPAEKNRRSENFGELAGKYSIERSSRALQGQVPPIRQYGGQPELEKEAFALKPATFRA